jgi:hypothetical protein
MTTRHSVLISRRGPARLAGAGWLGPAGLAGLAGWGRLGWLAGAGWLGPGQPSRLSTIVGRSMMWSARSGRTAVPMAKNSVVCDPQVWLC